MKNILSLRIANYDYNVAIYGTISILFLQNAFIK